MQNVGFNSVSTQQQQIKMLVSQWPFSTQAPY